MFYCMFYFTCGRSLNTAAAGTEHSTCWWRLLIIQLLKCCYRPTYWPRACLSLCLSVCPSVRVSVSMCVSVFVVLWRLVSVSGYHCCWFYFLSVNHAFARSLAFSTQPMFNHTYWVQNNNVNNNCSAPLAAQRYMYLGLLLSVRFFERRVWSFNGRLGRSSNVFIGNVYKPISIPIQPFNFNSIVITKTLFHLDQAPAL